MESVPESTPLKTFTNVDPKKGGGARFFFEKRKGPNVFQPKFFRGHLLVFGGGPLFLGPTFVAKLFREKKHVFLVLGVNFFLPSNQWKVKQ